jgi:hypothetical protein
VKRAALRRENSTAKDLLRYDEDMSRLSAFVSLHPYFKVRGVEWPPKI